MELLKKLSLLLLLSIFVIGATTYEAEAANYCEGGADFSYDEVNNVRVEKGSTAEGACHIQHYHMASPGSRSAIVDYLPKSQFTFSFDRKSMANIAALVIKNSTPVKSGGNWIAESYVVTLNQDVRVVWYESSRAKGKKLVISMYPTKSYGPDGPIHLPTVIEPITELEQ